MDSVPRLCAAILTAEPRPLDRGVVPEGLRQIILRCLEKNPHARYPNILELARALAPFAPPTERRSLELIERLVQRPSPEVEVKRASEPVVAATPPNQSTTAGFSQDTRVSGGEAAARSSARAFGRRGLWAFLGVAAIGGAVALTTRDEQTPGAEPSAVEPIEPRSIAAKTVPNPGPAAASSAAHVGSSPSVPSAAPAVVQPARRDVRRLPAGTGAPAPSAAPAPGSISVPPSPAPSAQATPVVPSAAPTAGSSDDFDRHIYRR
jgi:serine/threonine-protein kinase